MNLDPVNHKVSFLEGILLGSTPQGQESGYWSHQGFPMPVVPIWDHLYDLVCEVSRYPLHVLKAQILVPLAPLLTF